MTEIINDDYVWTEDNSEPLEVFEVLADKNNKAGAVEEVEGIVEVVRELEENSKKALNIIKDDKSTHVLVENNKKKTGRPLGSCKPKVDKEKRKMLKELKKIWANEDNKKDVKGSDIVAAASLFAELQGWRIKTPIESAKNDSMTITFTKDAPKSIAKPPANKMLTGVPIIKVEPANPPATTANDSNVSSKVVG